MTRELGAATGWHKRPDWRLNALEAADYATRLEASGRYWCQVFPLAQGVALVHVRLRKRPSPLVFTFRTKAECLELLAEVGQPAEKAGSRQLALFDDDRSTA